MKYSKYDIENGYNLFNIGIRNIIEGLSSSNPKYILDFPISLDLLYVMLSELYSSDTVFLDASYGDLHINRILYTDIKNNIIIEIHEDKDSVIFSFKSIENA